jgi:OOP family OmpA-OmpF porin
MEEEIPMRLRSLVLFSAILLTAGLATAGQDAEGSKDPALFTRMPHYTITNFDDKQFDAYDFTVKKGNSEEKQHIEGHTISIRYDFDGSTGSAPSPLQIVRNYENAARKVGGKVLYEAENDWATLLIAKDGKETWVELDVKDNGTPYLLKVVERETMQQDVVANADSLKSGLAENGHAEVAGIFFDFNKSDVKPESKPALDEVAKMLKANPSLKVWVVGHTDNVGSAESNVTLANARAAAVVKALVQGHGINATRLAAQGVGPYAPVATNTTEEGRARNRRVELVARP